MKIVKSILAICFLLALAQADFAKLGTTGAQFLKIGIGRGAAMGEVFTAVSDDASATYWNPAGLAWLKNRELQLHQNFWIGDLNHDYLAIALPFSGFGTVGISLNALTMGDFEYLTVDDPATRQREDTSSSVSFSAMDLAFGASYARMFTDKLSAGVTMKTIQQRIWDMSASAIAFDFGTFYNTGFKSLRLGAVLSNFGTELSYSGRQLDWVAQVPFDSTSELNRERIPVTYKTTPYPLPMVFRFGFAYNVIDQPISKLTVAADLIHPSDNFEQIGAGLEYGYNDFFFVRAGYKIYTSWKYTKAMMGGEAIIDTTDNTIIDYDIDNLEDNLWMLNNLTGGVGFNLKTTNLRFKLDYAYMNKGVLRHTHKVGVGIAF
jgi:hypothetical protein